MAQPSYRYPGGGASYPLRDVLQRPLGKHSIERSQATSARIARSEERVLRKQRHRRRFTTAGLCANTVRLLTIGALPSHFYAGHECVPFLGFPMPESGGTCARNSIQTGYNFGPESRPTRCTARARMVRSLCVSRESLALGERIPPSKCRLTRLMSFRRATHFRISLTRPVDHEPFASHLSATFRVIARN